MQDRKRNIFIGVFAANIILMLAAYAPKLFPIVLMVLITYVVYNLVRKFGYQSGGRVVAEDTGASEAGSQKLLNYECRNAADYLQRGRRKAGAGSRAGAVEDFTRAIELEPDMADAYFARGYVRDDMRDYEGALYDWEKAVSLKPAFESTLRHKINTVKIKIRPKDKTGTAEEYMDSGFAKMCVNDFSAAAADFGKAIELKPHLAEAYSNRGIARGKSGDYSGAFSDLTRAMELQPSLKPDIQPLLEKIRDKIEIKN